MFRHGSFGQINLTESNFVAFLPISYWFTEFNNHLAYRFRIILIPRILLMLIQHQSSILIHYLLHSILHKLVKTLELLSHQSLLLKEGINNRPVILLLQLILLFLLWLLSTISERIRFLFLLGLIFGRIISVRRIILESVIPVDIDCRAYKVL